MKKQLESFDESEMVRTQAIIQSMTPSERTNPKILNGSRRARIALGSGRSVKEVNTLVDRFSAAQKAMKQLRNGGIPAGLPAGLSGGIPGMPPMPRGGGFKHPLQQGNQKNQKKKSRSGNPAKRAAEEGR
jgi:signal recognition particle subunit SRP54